MSNWWNEVFIEEGWMNMDEEPYAVDFEDDKIDESLHKNCCKICGSRTGQHGFSFDKKVW